MAAEVTHLLSAKGLLQDRTEIPTETEEAEKGAVAMRSPRRSQKRLGSSLHDQKTYYSNTLFGRLAVEFSKVEDQGTDSGTFKTTSNCKHPSCAGRRLAAFG